MCTALGELCCIASTGDATPDAGPEPECTHTAASTCASWSCAACSGGGGGEAAGAPSRRAALIEDVRVFVRLVIGPTLGEDGEGPCAAAVAAFAGVSMRRMVRHMSCEELCSEEGKNLIRCWLKLLRHHDTARLPRAEVALHTYFHGCSL